MDQPVELVVGGLEAQEVAVGAGRAPDLEVVVGPLAEAEGDRQVGLGLDAEHDLGHPVGVDAVVLAGLQHDRAVAVLPGLVGAGEDLVGAHAVALDLAVGGSQATVPAGPHAVVRELDQAAQVDLVAHVATTGVVGGPPELLEAPRVVLAQPRQDGAPVQRGAGHGRWRGAGPSVDLHRCHRSLSPVALSSAPASFPKARRPTSPPLAAGTPISVAASDPGRIRGLRLGLVE